MLTLEGGKLRTSCSVGSCNSEAERTASQGWTEGPGILVEV